MTTVYQSENTALWFQRSCTSAFEFLGCHDVSDLTRPRGEITFSRQRDGKNNFKVVSSRQAIPDNGTVSITLYRQVVNLLDELPCPPNLLIFYSNCGADDDETNFDFIDVLDTLRITEISQAGVVNAIGADGEGDVGVDILQEISAEFENFYTIKPLSSSDLTIAALDGRIIADISVCDPDAECGDPTCDEDETIGCQTLWIITNGSPGLYGDARIFKSTDGGTTLVEQTNSMTVDNDNLSAVDCSLDVVVVTNGDTAEYQYTNDGGTTWVLVTTPDEVLNDVFVLSQTKIWFAADNGNIYFSNDKGASISTQDDGVATTENLNSIWFSDSDEGYSVGDNNAFVRTVNAGTNWNAVTGPSVGINLNVVHGVSDSKIIFIGDASGNVFRSTDRGDTWTTVITGWAPFAGGITDIAICQCNRVLISGIDVNGLGSVRESKNGGTTFTAVTTPVVGADSINALTCCDVNTYYGVGDDGLIFKLAGETFRDSA